VIDFTWFWNLNANYSNIDDNKYSDNADNDVFSQSNRIRHYISCNYQHLHLLPTFSIVHFRLQFHSYVIFRIIQLFHYEQKRKFQMNKMQSDLVTELLLLNDVSSLRNQVFVHVELLLIFPELHLIHSKSIKRR